MESVAADGKLKATPPPATPKVLPRPLILKPARVTFHKDDNLIVRYIRTRFKVTELQNLEEEDFRKLNISSTDFLPLVELLSKEYIPPDSWLVDPRDSLERSKPSERPTYIAVLSNGTKRPDRDDFYGFAIELLADLATVYRSSRRDPPPEGLRNIAILHFRKFWIALHNVGRYWDDSLDTLETTAENKDRQDEQPVSIKVKTAPIATDSDVYTVTSDEETSEEESVVRNFTYTGRRTSTGSQMKSILSLNLAEAFLEPLMYAFGCHFDQVSQGAHDLFFVDSVTTCLHTKLIFSRPKDPALAKRGVLEGPIAVLHAHASVKFGPDTHGEIDLFVRELKAILLCAQQRSRENGQAFSPGGGEWWSLSSGKWGHALNNGAGGLPGEAVGDSLTDLDLFPENPPAARPAATSATTLQSRSSGRQNLAATCYPNENGSEQSAKNQSDEDLDEFTEDGELIPPGSPKGRIKVAPLTGEELRFRLRQSTLARPSLYLGESEDDLSSSYDYHSSTESLSATSDASDPAASKKRSFGTFTKHDTLPTAGEEIVSADRDTKIALDMDTERAQPPRNSEPSKRSVLSSKSANDTRSDGFGLISHDESLKTRHESNSHPDGYGHEIRKNDQYKSMLKHLREKSEPEQKARQIGVKMANRPAKNPFSSKHKNTRRIGMHPLASHDEVR